jgi:hypothetical protein
MARAVLEAYPDDEPVVSPDPGWRTLCAVLYSGRAALGLVTIALLVLSAIAKLQLKAVLAV